MRSWKRSFLLGLVLGAAACSADLTSGSDTPDAAVTGNPGADGGTGSITISGTPRQLVTAGVAYSFQPTVTDPGGGTLTFSITSRPRWAAFDERTGALSGTPAAADVATYAGIVIKVSNGSASASLPTFSITVVPAGVPVDLCTGLKMGKGMVPFSALAKPAKGQQVTDPDFGTRITRITDAKADWNASVAIPVYPTIQAWNADESLLILYATQGLGGNSQVGHALFDGKTYAFKRWLDINPADIEQFYWDTTNPDLLYYVDNFQDTGAWHNVLTRLHVSSGAKDAIHDFSRDASGGGALKPCAGTTSVSGGEDPFSMSLDNDLIGLGCYLGHNGPGGSSAFQAFSYRISTNTIGANFLVEADVPQANPSGSATYFYADEKQVQIFDPVTNALRRSIAFDGTQHSDMLRNGAGDDVVAGAQFDGPSGSGTLMWANLSQGGAVHTIIGMANGDPYPPSGTLVSGRAYQRPGWVAVGVIGEIQLTSTYLDQEILLANLDSGVFCRAAHHRSTGDFANARESNYWAQPNVTLSPSGTRILFQSDWGDATPGPAATANPNAIVDTYVLELPTYAP